MDQEMDSAAKRQNPTRLKTKITSTYSQLFIQVAAKIVYDRAEIMLFRKHSAFLRADPGLFCGQVFTTALATHVACDLIARDAFSGRAQA
jgi:hypothetical protein